MKQKNVLIVALLALVLLWLLTRYTEKVSSSISYQSGTYVDSQGRLIDSATGVILQYPGEFTY